MPFPTPPTVQSARLCIRPVAQSDLPALMHVNGDGEVTRYLPYASWRSLDDANAWYERMAGLQAGGTALQFVIALRDTGAAIGTGLLFQLVQEHGRAELGYALGREHWGAGYMHEAMDALVACAFDTLSLRRLEAQVDPRNTASIRVLQRLGFTREGLLRQRAVSKGEARDLEIHGLLQHEWQARGGA